jgi:hypothetical protein
MSQRGEEAQLPACMLHATAAFGSLTLLEVAADLAALPSCNFAVPLTACAMTRLQCESRFQGGCCIAGMPLYHGKSCIDFVYVHAWHAKGSVCHLLMGIGGWHWVP